MKTILILILTLLSCNEASFVHREFYQNEICITMDLYKQTTSVCGKNCEKCPSNQNTIPKTFRLVTVFKQTHLVDKCKCDGSVYVYQKKD